MKIPNLPSRFENFKLNRGFSYTTTELERLKAFVFQMPEATTHIKRMIRTMKASNSGAFMILKGESGIGKTTFLNTLPLYIEKLEVRSIYNRNKNLLSEEFEIIKGTNYPRIIILENRETFETLSSNQLEKEIHTINSFIRSEAGENTIVVWPCNGEEMTKEIIQFAGHIGGSSLFREDTILEYIGLPKNRFIPILKSTYEFFNSYDISDVGFSDEQLEEILNSMKTDSTIGNFLEKVRSELLKDYNIIEDSKDYMGDFFSLIICVIAGNNPSNEIDYLTKGDYSLVDMDRLFSATTGNIKSVIGKNKRICAMVAKEINCKIISINSQDVLDILRIETNNKSSNILEFDKYIEDECKLKLGKSLEQIEILKSMDLISGINGQAYKRKKRKLIPTDSQSEFNTILKLAQTNDRQINNKICEVLKDNNLISVGRVEDSFGNVYQVRSDMLCSIPGKYIRVEFMWRDLASAASISLYSLNKLYGYCQAMGVL